MQLRVSNISSTGTTLSFQLPKGPLNERLNNTTYQQQIITKDVSVTATCLRTLDGASVTANLTVNYSDLCSRCAKPCSGEVNSNINFVVKERTPDAPHFEDIGIHQYENDEVDLGQILEDDIILLLPPYSQCSENCQGRCSLCGIDKNESDCKCNPAPSSFSLQLSSALLGGTKH